MSESKPGGRAIAVMQPYLFPYIGYFRLAKTVDHFVFLDDVNFIKKGWINRNYIFSQQGPLLITVPLEKASQNELISRTRITVNRDWVEKMRKQFRQSYVKAPYFDNVYPLIESVLEEPHETISSLAVASVRSTLNYLGHNFSSSLSSDLAIEGARGSDRILEICLNLGASLYVNPPGGVDLYSPQDFLAKGIELRFLRSTIPSYLQFGTPAGQPYSIIDVLMFNSVDQVNELLKEGELLSKEELTREESLS